MFLPWPLSLSVPPQLHGSDDRNRMRFLFQCRFGERRVLIDSFIGTKYIRRSLYRYPEHPKLVPERFHELHSILHSLELATKRAGLHSILAFAVPHDRSAVTEDQYTSL